MSWLPLFSDDFNRANSQVVGNGWSQSPSPAVGSSGIIGNTLWNIDQSNPLHLSRAQSFGNTLAIEADILNRGNGFWMGFSSEVGGAWWGNGYALRYILAGGQEVVSLSLMNSGALGLVIGSYILPTAFTGNLRLERSQTGDFTLFVDGTQVEWAQGWSVTDTTYMTPADPATYGLRMALYVNDTNQICQVDNFAAQYKITDGTGYTLTYDANGGTNPPAVQFGDTEYTVAAQGSMSRASHTFLRWNTAADGSGTNYTPASTITLTAPTTLYAIWERVYEPIWCDNFDRANSSTVGNGWSQYNATSGLTFGILSNRLRLTHTTTAQVYLAREGVEGGTTIVGVMDGDLTSNNRMYLGFKSVATAGAVAGGEVGYDALFRPSDSCILYRYNGSTATTLAIVSYGDLRGKTCAFKYDGDNIVLLVDGSPILTVIDSSFRPTNPTVRLFSGANLTYVDDVCIWNAADYPPPAPPTSFRPRRQRMAALGGF